MVTSKEEYMIWQRRHPNFMTPNVRKLLIKGDDVIEISEGRGMDNERIFGVTHVRKQAFGGFKTKGGMMFRKASSADTYSKYQLRKVL